MNAPASFQKIMDKIFNPDDTPFIIPYLDDLIIFSQNEEEHLKHLEVAFKKKR